MSIAATERPTRVRVRFTVASTVVFAAVVVGAALLAPSVGSFVVVLGALAVVAGSVTVHELAHAAAAHRLGFDVLEVRVGLIDSATAYEADERTAHDRVLCALAGPAASLALAAALSALTWLPGVEGQAASALGTAAVLNLLVAVANLVPVPGTDGGEILAGLRGDAG